MRRYLRAHAVLAAAVLLAAAPAAAQRSVAEDGADPNYTVPKTPWGHPDLQGAWTSDGARGIPTQRPEQFGTRAFLTDAEFAEKELRDRQSIESALAATGVNTGGRDAMWRGSKTFRQTSLLVDPPDGRYPPFTADAERRREPRDRGSFGNGPFRGPEDFTLYDRCITRGIVGGVLPVPYGNGNRILQTPDSFVISYEMVHDTRIVPLDGRPRLGPDIRPLLGDARGHWEGDTLVVVTTNFTDRTSIGPNGNGLRHSADMRMTERFTRVAEDVLRYEITIDDPETYTTPFTLSVPLVSPPGFEPLPYECHEGNGAVRNILSAERTEDVAIEEDRKRGIVRPRKDPQNDISRDPFE